MNNLDHKRITKENLSRILTYTFGDVFSGKGKLFAILEKSNLINKGLMIYDEYSFINVRPQPNNLCWDISYFKLLDILANLDVRRQHVIEIIDSIQSNKGTIVVGHPYSGKSTILRRIIVELAKDYLILFLERPVEITHSSLKSVFLQITNYKLQITNVL